MSLKKVRASAMVLREMSQRTATSTARTAAMRQTTASLAGETPVSLRFRRRFSLRMPNAFFRPS